MPFKFTLLFNFGGSGFSESWYYTGAAPAASLALNTGDFAQLAKARQQMCAADVNLIGMRLSDVDNPRETMAEVLLAPNENPPLPDTVSNAWLALARGVGRKGRRQLWLRGLPDDEILFNQTTQRYLPQGGLAKAITSYETILKTKPWAIRTIQSKKAAGAAAEAITAITTSAAGGSAVLTGPGAVDFTKTQIVAGFKKPLSYLNGTYLPLSGYINDGTGKVALLHRPLSTFEALGYPGGASIRPQVFSYTAVDSCKLEFPRSRRVGRAFFVAAGRR